MFPVLFTPQQYSLYCPFATKPQPLIKGYTCQLRPPQIISPLQAATIVPAIVRLAYVIPSNRTPQVNGVANFQKIVKQGQQWFEAQMKRNGMGSKTRSTWHTFGITERQYQS
jgi:hypothetical protein